MRCTEESQKCVVVFFVVVIRRQVPVDFARHPLSLTPGTEADAVNRVDSQAGVGVHATARQTGKVGMRETSGRMCRRAERSGKSTA